MNAYYSLCPKGIIISLLLLMLIGTGCTETPNNIKQDSGQVAIAMFVPPTRSGVSDVENHIQSVCILTFTEEPSGEVVFFGYWQATDIEQSVGGDFSYKRIKAQLPVSSKRQHVILIANASSELNAIFGTLSRGESKISVLEKITYSCDGKWDKATPRYLPMWGESKDAVFIDGTNPVNLNLNLLRSVAQITLTGVPQTGSITFDQVRVYYTNNKGYVASQASSGYTHESNKVSFASVPPGAGFVSGNFTAYDYTTTPVSTISRDIYIPESKKSGAWVVEMPCVVAKIKQQDARGTSIYEGWYRIDLLGDDGNVQDMLRNHTYAIEVSALSGNGRQTPEEAVATKPVDIAFGTIAWNNMEISDITDEGQYSLTIDRTHIEVEALGTVSYFENRAYRVLVRTNHPQGWSATTENGSGVVIRTPSGDNNGYTELTFDMQDNDTYKEKTDKIIVTAGKIKREIEVTSKFGIDYTTGNAGYFILANIDARDATGKKTYLGSDAATACPAGWRTPTQTELILAYVAYPDYDKKIGFVTSGYYSTTTKPNDDTKQYMTVFAYGGTSPGHVSPYPNTSSSHVRCIKDNAASVTKYPYVSNKNGYPVIISREGDEGLARELLHEKWVSTSPNAPIPHHLDSDHEKNRLSEIMRVATTTCTPANTDIAYPNNFPLAYSTSSSLTVCGNYFEEIDKSDRGTWRLPTQRELMLIWAMGGAPADQYPTNETHSSYNLPFCKKNGGVALYDIPGFSPLTTLKTASYGFFYIALTKSFNRGDLYWTIDFTKYGYCYDDIAFDGGSLRCVKDIQ